VENSKVLEKYGKPASEYFAIEDGWTSIVDHLDCQSNHKYLDASLLNDSRNGTPKNKVLLAFLILKKVE
jgi:hypothetical protein